MSIIYQNLDNACFITTTTKQIRFEFDSSIRNYVQQSIPFEISDCGVFKNPPGWVYPIHIDAKRTCAINILLCEENPEFLVYFYGNRLDKPIPLNYKKDVPYLLNTKKLHGVKNLSKDKTRFVLTIGNTTDSYEDVLKRFKL